MQRKTKISEMPIRNTVSCLVFSQSLSCGVHSLYNTAGQHQTLQSGFTWCVAVLHRLVPVAEGMQTRFWLVLVLMWEQQ